MDSNTFEELFQMNRIKMQTKKVIITICLYKLSKYLIIVLL